MGGRGGEIPLYNHGIAAVDAVQRAVLCWKRGGAMLAEAAGGVSNFGNITGKSHAVGQSRQEVVRVDEVDGEQRTVHGLEASRIRRTHARRDENASITNVLLLLLLNDWGGHLVFEMSVCCEGKYFLGVRRGRSGTRGGGG